MKNVVRLAVAVAVIVVSSVSPASSVLINPDLIKGTSLFEGYGAATHIGPRRLFAWSNGSGRNGQRLNAWAETNGGTLTRFNARGTDAYVGGFDQGKNLLIFQQVRKGESDLFFYDVAARRRFPARALNDGHWQWNPSMDTHRGTTWIVYGVNRFGSPTAKWRFFLYNSATKERVLLDETTNQCGCLFPGTIAYPWVTWAVGADATAWRYDIRTGERTPLLPTDRDEYGVTITGNGTAYVAQAGDRCGSSAALYRVGLDGTPFLLRSFRPGREASNLSLDDTGPHDRLYYDKRNCRTGSSDIWRLRRAERVGDPAHPRASAGAFAGDGATRWEASSGAPLRTR